MHCVFVWCVCLACFVAIVFVAVCALVVVFVLFGCVNSLCYVVGNAVVCLFDGVLVCELLCLWL